MPGECEDGLLQLAAAAGERFAPTAVSGPLERKPAASLRPAASCARAVGDGVRDRAGFGHARTLRARERSTAGCAAGVVLRAANVRREPLHRGAALDSGQCRPRAMPKGAGARAAKDGAAARAKADRRRRGGRHTGCVGAPESRARGGGDRRAAPGPGLPYDVLACFSMVTAIDHRLDLVN